MDGSLPVSSVRGISQARVLEWVAISYSKIRNSPSDWNRESGSFIPFSNCFGYNISEEAPPPPFYEEQHL